jgi:nicotinamidase-related amidase
MYRVFLIAAGLALLAAPAGPLSLSLRTRVEPFRGGGDWREVRVAQQLPPQETALIICDMWDNHWCQDAARRTGILAHKAAPVIDAAREHGILIIHAPSDTMDFYKDAPQRRRILEIPKAEPPTPLQISEPPLPIDDTDGGCDTPNNPLPVNFKAWKRQHAAIKIAEQDLISDNGTQVYSALKQRGIKNLLIMGVHTNMCVLNRTFAIRQMTKWGVRCILIRDLTDAMYNPGRKPFVNHDAGTQMVIEHIEKYWAPTITSGELMKALRPS